MSARSHGTRGTDVHLERRGGQEIAKKRANRTYCGFIIFILLFWDRIGLEVGDLVRIMLHMGDLRERPGNDASGF